MAHFSSSLSFSYFLFVSLYRPLVLDVLRRTREFARQNAWLKSYKEEREREALGFSNPNTMVAQDVNFKFIMQIRFKQ